jgi:tRNA dimethylallyltransferase
MAPPLDPPLIIVTGPTASGKSALAIALAEEFSGTVINADSMQVYRGLDVLTAQPAAAERARLPHRLYGVIDAAEACSVGRWRGLALAEIAAARAAGRRPILVGGTGLYLRGLLHGLAEVPAIPPDARDQSRRLHAKIGGAAFRAALAEHDAETAGRLAPGDAQRLVRAYEVAIATGIPLSDWLRRQAGTGLPAVAIVLLPPRAALYRACDARFLAMMEHGALAEVEALLARGLDPALPAMKAVGVRELGDILEDRATRMSALAAAQQATRRYAKRQYTWLRHQMPERVEFRKLVIAAQFSESLLPKIFSFIRSLLLTVKL